MPRYRAFANGIMADVFAPPSKGRQEVALFLPGFPATLGENSLTKLLQKTGYTVVFPHYRGTYDSSGEFTPIEAIATAREIMEGLEAGEMRDTKSNYRASLPSKVTVCCGYSFGCFVTLHVAPSLVDVRSVLFFSPALTYGPAEVSSGFRESGLPFLDYVRRSRPLTYRLGAEPVWRNFYEGKMNLVGNEVQRAALTVDCFLGGRDGSFDQALFVKNFKTIVQGAFPAALRIDLHVVKQGEHSIDTLVPELERNVSTLLPNNSGD